MALIDYLDRGTLRNPQGECLVSADGEAMRFAEVRELSCRIANKLISLGFAPGEVGSVLAFNDCTAFACTFGLSRAGLAWLPANPRNSEDDSQYLFDFMDCRVLFFQSGFAPLIRSLKPQLPGVREYVCLDEPLDDMPSLTQWLEGAEATDPDLPRSPDDVVILFPTGGTTGRSKGVQMTGRVIHNFVAAYCTTMCYDQAEQPVNMAAAPLTHAAGIISYATMLRGGRTIILPKPDVGLMLDIIERQQVTEFFLPPTVIYRMLEHPDVESRDYRSLKYFVYAAAPMSVEKLKRALSVFGPCMTQMYGQAECPALIAFFSPQEHMPGGQPAPDSRLAACGFPTPFLEVRILDEDGAEVPAGEKGEICVRGDMVMAGYYKQPDKTAETIVDGWLHTGDIGVQDADGWLRIVDRKKDMIITGGLNVYPQEVEQVIWGHAAVEDCAVIGVPHEDWGEQVVAVVELAPGGSVEADELITLCKQALGSVKSPKSVEFRSLPRSPNGKVLKRDLRDEYWAGQDKKI
ncbi:MAG: long-chain fatty acid--CoA ligase [Salinisphaeraceae bacterium]|nr:long-chain fatty acid--CoA ligase [Salinisphaeraceae bacterium]